MPKSRLPKTPTELKEDFSRQVRLLISACNLYDNGDADQYINIATRLAVLLYDANRGPSVSLMTSIGQKLAIDYLDTGSHYFRPNTVEAIPSMTGTHLIMSKIDVKTKETTWVKRTDMQTVKDFNEPRWVNFEMWWNGPVLSRIDDSTGKDELKIIRREDLILTTRNQHGGAHADISVDEEFLRYSRAELSHWNFANRKISAGDPIPLTLRQIAYEFLESLAKANLS